MDSIQSDCDRTKAAPMSPRSILNSERENNEVASLQNQLRKIRESVAATRQKIEDIRHREGLHAVQLNRILREAVAPSIGHSEHEDMPFTEVQIR